APRRKIAIPGGRQLRRAGRRHDDTIQPRARVHGPGIPAVVGQGAWLGPAGKNRPVLIIMGRTGGPVKRARAWASRSPEHEASRSWAPWSSRRGGAATSSPSPGFTGTLPRGAYETPP